MSHSDPEMSWIGLSMAQSMVPELPPTPEIPRTTPQGVRLVKLPRSAMRTHAVRLLKEQGGLCPLCRKPIDLSIKGEGVIDHDHDSGRIRGLLHRSCNAAEGKISNAAARWGAKSSKYADIVPYLQALVGYLLAEPTQFIYPMHKTPDEKRDASLKKKREAAAALLARRELARQARLKGANE